MNDPGIIRNRAKIEATISNARVTQSSPPRDPEPSTRCSGDSRPPRRDSPPASFDEILPRPTSRRPPAARSRSSATASSVRPRSTPSCNPPAWSTTMSPAAGVPRRRLGRGARGHGARDAAVPRVRRRVAGRGQPLRVVLLRGLAQQDAPQPWQEDGEHDPPGLLAERDVAEVHADRETRSSRSRRPGRAGAARARRAESRPRATSSGCTPAPRPAPDSPPPCGRTSST